MNAWGGESDEYDWPASMHGIHVDHEGNVWLGGNGPEDHQILKFNQEGEFLMQIGARGQNQRSHDTENVGGPSTMVVDPGTNELYVADGTNNVIWTLDRATLEPVGYFARGGRQPGQFDWLHNLGVDSQGNLYTAEVQTGHRVQKFERIGGN